MNLFILLKRKWISENVRFSLPASDEELISFKSNNRVLLPNDLTEYFKILNGTQNQYDNKLFEFYSIGQVKKINDEYKDWLGIPNYKNIVNTLKDYEKYYVFANYSFHLFAFVIKLNNHDSLYNEVLVLCGDEYKKIANSFTEFIELYLNDPIALQL